MPTENRSSNTEMVSVPRHMLERATDNKHLEKERISIHRHEALFALRGLLAQPAPQPHPEPIAWMVGTAFWWTKEEAERDAAAIGLPVVGLGPMTGSAPAQQHQGEPIMLTAVATLVEDGDGGLEASWLLEGGTAELFAGMTLLVADNAPDLCSEDGSAQLYPHADPGEVERLRDELEIVKNNDLKWRGLREQEAEIENLRTQLAERDALLREALPAVEYESGRGDAAGTSYLQLADKIKSLSASAEPSAPVEIDERADFERHVILTTGRPIDSELKRHPVRHDEYECRTMQTRWNDWQARAALDRKPS